MSARRVRVFVNERTQCWSRSATTCHAADWPAPARPRTGEGSSRWRAAMLRISARSASVNRNAGLRPRGRPAGAAFAHGFAEAAQNHRRRVLGHRSQSLLCAVPIGWPSPVAPRRSGGRSPMTSSNADEVRLAGRSGLALARIAVVETSGRRRRSRRFVRAARSGFRAIFKGDSARSVKGAAAAFGLLPLRATSSEHRRASRTRRDRAPAAERSHDLETTAAYAALEDDLRRLNHARRFVSRRSSPSIRNARRLSAAPAHAIPDGRSEIARLPPPAPSGKFTAMPAPVNRLVIALAQIRHRRRHRRQSRAAEEARAPRPRLRRRPRDVA